MSNPNESVRDDQLNENNHSFEESLKNEQPENVKDNKKDAETPGIDTNNTTENDSSSKNEESRQDEIKLQKSASEVIDKTNPEKEQAASDSPVIKNSNPKMNEKNQDADENVNGAIQQQNEQTQKQPEEKNNITENSAGEPEKVDQELKDTETEELKQDQKQQLHNTELTDSSDTNPGAEKKDKTEEDEKVSTTDKQKDQKKKEPGGESHEEKDQNEEEKPDYDTLSREELVKTLDQILSTRPVHKIRHDVETIKVLFYKRHKAEIEKKKKEFLETGGDTEAFSPGEDPLETLLKENMKRFRDLKAEYNRNLEVIKQKNLEKKYAIIDEIKDLVNRKESINETFQQFRELQNRWRDIGVVPQQNLKDLWETYHHHVEKFYDYIKINKELKDLDLKKNLEAKVKLCEMAEELLLETSVVKAFNTLQKYHNQWREIGPVPREVKEDIWNRFKEATSKINKKHQEFYDELKESQKQNLKQKVVLCQKAEEISNQTIENNKEWENKSRELIEIQKVWKTIGFAPKKDNNKIYQRFRNACDSFFKRKRDFYSQYKQEQLDNLQLKTDLCIQAESIKDSTEWKKTTDELINIQKRWKEIGPVPRKQSDHIWKRFRAACDTFFNRKSEHFSKVDSGFLENLKKKSDLIKRINNFTPSDKVEENFEALKEFQHEWSEIGYVPIKNKDEINHAYRDAINKRFDELKVDEGRKNILRFQTKVENLAANQKTNKLRNERDKLISKLKQLENDIILWENNIGFFAKSKNADAMIREVRGRIDRAKEEIVTIEEKIRVIDSADEEE